MADRNYDERGGRDYDERNRWGGRDPQGEGRGREWGAGEREGQGREAGAGRGYAEENRSGNDWYGRDTAGREGWGSDRGYGRDIDWRTDWRQGQAQRAQQGQGPSQQGQGQDWSQDRSRRGGPGPGWNPQGRFGSQGGYGLQQSQSRPGSWTEGPHSGKGPQGYQRSNERIHEEVCEALTRHSHVDASTISIRVENGEITLEGTVSSRREKRMAEEAVENLSGVRDVHNHLRVGQPSASPGNGDVSGTPQETSAAHQAGLEEGSAATTVTGATSGAGTGSTGRRRGKR